MSAKLLLGPLLAVVIGVTDGDTVKVRIPAWSTTPFEVMAIRVDGIDTPESMRNLAKCPRELVRGAEAKAYARSLIQPEETLNFTFHGFDKYGGRIDGSIMLPDGRDFGTVMIAAGHARSYHGGTKSSWCD
jgi:micrococcal nuclease